MNSLLCAVSSLLIIGFSTSCVSTKNVALSAADRAAMQGKTFSVATRAKPSFFVLKPSAAAAATLAGPIGGGIAGGMAEKEGQAQIEKHRVANPNDPMSREVAKALVATTGAKQIAQSKTTTNSLVPSKVAAENPNADYVLDCFTTAWMGTYYPFGLDKYYITFAAKMQLIETSTGRVVAEGFISHQDKDRANAPDYDGIYSNDAAYLKTETKKGTDAAISVFTGLF